eukprot:scaffold5520_cov167-Amphora_coffeaeformis.AAC.3
MENRDALSMSSAQLDADPMVRSICNCPVSPTRRHKDRPPQMYLRFLQRDGEGGIGALSHTHYNPTLSTYSYVILLGSISLNALRTNS